MNKNLVYKDATLTVQSQELCRSMYAMTAHNLKKIVLELRASVLMLTFI